MKLYYRYIRMLLKIFFLAAAFIFVIVAGSPQNLIEYEDGVAYAPPAVPPNYYCDLLNLFLSNKKNCRTKITQ